MLEHRPPFCSSTIYRSGPGAGGGAGGARIDAADPLFAGHFPGEPVYPGVLQLETMGQLGLCLLHFCATRLASSDAGRLRSAPSRSTTRSSCAEAGPATSSPCWRQARRLGRLHGHRAPARFRDGDLLVRRHGGVPCRRTNRIVITGMAINTPLGDTLDGFLEESARRTVGHHALEDARHVAHLLQGRRRSLGVRRRRPSWRSFDGRSRPTSTSGCASWSTKAPWSTRLDACCCALDGYLDAGLFDHGLDLARRRGHRRRPQHQLELPVREPPAVRRGARLHRLAAGAHRPRHRPRRLASPRCSACRGPSTRWARPARAPTWRCAARSTRSATTTSTLAVVVGRRARLLADRPARDGAHGRDHLPELQRRARAGQPALRHAARGLRAGARRRGAGARGARARRSAAARASTPRCSAWRPTPTATTCRSPPRRARRALMTRLLERLRRGSPSRSTTSTPTRPRRRSAT